MKTLIDKMDSYDAANNDGHINYAIMVQRIGGTTEVTIYSNFDEAGELVVAHGSAARLGEYDNQWFERAVVNCMKILEAKHGLPRVV